jgi:hypothetical protein
MMQGLHNVWVFVAAQPWYTALLLSALFLLIATLLGVLAFHLFIGLPLSVVRGKDRVADRQQGWVHLGIGAATLAGAAVLTWLAYQFQITWLGGSSHLVTAGAFVVGVYELFYGAGILLFRTGVLGVLMLMYGFLYALLHYTLKVI